MLIKKPILTQISEFIKLEYMLPFSVTLKALGTTKIIELKGVDTVFLPALEKKASEA